MDGSISNLSNFMQGSNRLYIPVYQRNYDWHINNCKRLMDDLFKIQKEERKRHFFGSIVVKGGNLHGETIVIDGQQRLTTISLLLLAISNYLKENKNNSLISSEQILNQYLINQWGKPGDNYKIISNPRDYEAYKKLFENSNYHDHASNLTTNYEYFYDTIEKLPVSVEQLLDSVQRLQVMVINLHDEDDPQLVFESLNSTGLSLTDADRIRNFLLMNEERGEQEFLFKRYWEPIEEHTHFELSDFFRYYLTIKLVQQPNQNEIYEIFRDYYNVNYKSKRLFFDELTEYANAYRSIVDNYTGKEMIDNILFRFNQISVTVIYPFLMAILRDLSLGEMNYEDVVDILTVIESYLARRMITQTPSNALNKIFASLYRDLKKNMSEEFSPAEIVAFILLNKQRSGFFPTDSDIEEALSTRNMYHINAKFRTYFFERMENQNHVETLNIYSGMQQGEITVEHIMPQTLTRSWKSELGQKFEEIHTKYLHNVGNLTLTGYNSQYSNHSFLQKKTMKNGFNESHFSFLNSIPKNNEVWGENQIIERRNQLIKTAKEVWKYPKTNFVPTAVDNQSDTYVFDGEETFTGYRLRGYRFKTEDYKEESIWINMYYDIVKEIAEEYPSQVQELASISASSGVASIFLLTPTTRAVELIPGIYIISHLSNSDKMFYLQLLFDHFGIKYDELEIDALPPNIDIKENE